MANEGANTGAATAKPGEAGAAGTGSSAAAAGNTQPGAGGGEAKKDDGAAGAGEGAGKSGEAGKAGETASSEAAGGKAGGEAPKPKAPEKYSLTVPDANQAISDSKLQARIEEIARASDWTNDEAQAALNEALTLKQQEIDEWRAQTQADPDYGGDKLPETQRLAQRGIDAVLPVGHKHRAGFLDLLTRSGIGNHPLAVAFFAELGAKTSEDKGARSGGPTGGQKSGNEAIAEALYDAPASRAVNEATRR